VNNERLNQIQLTPHFKLREFTRSGTADREGIDNHPSPHVRDHLQALCKNVLEPVRRFYNQPVGITSGYRSERLNGVVGGSPTSYHIQGKAADFYVGGVPNEVVFLNLYYSTLPITELIFYEKGWIHVAHDESKVDHMEVLYKPKNQNIKLFTDQIQI